MQQKWNPFYRRLLGQFRPDPIAVAQQALDNWFKGETGQYLLGKERETLERLPSLSGYHLMELGITSECTLPVEFEHYHRFCPSPLEHTNKCSVVTDFASLPLPSDIIDIAVLHHVLEFSSRPHTVLAEVSRVVAPSGHIVLFVLNPFSLFGLGKWGARLFDARQLTGRSSGKGSVWHHHSLRLGRLVDWLRLLNFRTVHVSRGGLGALQSAGDSHSLGIRRGYCLGLPAGMFYTIVARKHVVRPILNLYEERWNRLQVPGLNWQQPVRRMDMKKEKV